MKVINGRKVAFSIPGPAAHTKMQQIKRGNSTEEQALQQKVVIMTLDFPQATD